MNRSSAKSPPCTTCKEGWPSDQEKYRAASADRAAGVVFRSKHARKTTPSAPAKEASRHFIYGAATPPCCDARRRLLPYCDPCTASMTARFSRDERKNARSFFKAARYRACASRTSPTFKVGWLEWLPGVSPLASWSR